jgi:hypothetical protein
MSLSRAGGLERCSVANGVRLRTVFGCERCSSRHARTLFGSSRAWRRVSILGDQVEHKGNSPALAPAVLGARLVQLPLHPQRLWRAGFADLSACREPPSAGGPSLRTYVLARHPDNHPKRRSTRLRPGPRIHAARGRSRAPRPRPGAYAASAIHPTRAGLPCLREPAGTHQTQGTPHPWESGRSTARRVPGHRRRLRIGRVWRRLRRRARRPARSPVKRGPGPPSPDRADPPTWPAAARGAVAGAAGLHLARGSTPSPPAGFDRAGRTRLRAGRLGHTQIARGRSVPEVGRTAAGG